MIGLTFGVAGVMGMMADVAFAFTNVSPAVALLGSGGILAVWMSLILLQLTQGKNSGVLLLKYYLLLLAVALLAALFAWGLASPVSSAWRCCRWALQADLFSVIEQFLSVCDLFSQPAPGLC